MPCGGIYPMKGSEIGKFTTAQMPCWVCQKGNCDCFCDEWDTTIHSGCVESFLKTDEGQCVLDHGHVVAIMRDGQIVVLHEERTT